MDTTNLAATTIEPAAPEKQQSTIEPAGSPEKADNSEEPQDVSALPQWAQNLIHKTRTEAAEARTQGKNAATQARDDVVQAISKALGLADVTKTPTIEDLTTQAQTAQAQAIEARRELAIIHAAVALHVDAATLTDSRSFMAAVASLDPANTDAIMTAVQEHVRTHPHLAAGPQAGASAVDQPGQAPGRHHTAGSLAEAVTRHYQH